MAAQTQPTAAANPQAVTVDNFVRAERQVRTLAPRMGLIATTATPVYLPGSPLEHCTPDRGYRSTESRTDREIPRSQDEARDDVGLFEWDLPVASSVAAKRFGSHLRLSSRFLL